MALELLDKFFELNEPFDLAQAYRDKAAALLNPGNVEEAIKSYKQALKFEKNQGTAQTQAYLSLAMLFVEHETKQYFEFGIELLNENVDRLMFPVDYFRWHAAMAVFKYGLGDYTEASKQAGLALDAEQIKIRLSVSSGAWIGGHRIQKNYQGAECNLRITSACSRIAKALRGSLTAVARRYALIM